MDKSTYNPVRFFALTFLLTWIPWGIAAYLSYQSGMGILAAAFELLGLLGPMLAAVIMLGGARQATLRRDYRDRLLDLRRLKLGYLPVLVLLMPVAMLMATGLSVALGHSTDQFSPSNGLAGMITIILLAPTFEELGWRGYGIDSLSSRFRLMGATLLFGSLWALWHVPLFFIDHTYQHMLWTSSIISVANFFVSVFPAAILINWLYYRNSRSIVAGIFFHMTLVFTSEALQTEQFTKYLVTGGLLVVSLGVIATNRRLFFGEKVALPAD